MRIRHAPSSPHTGRAAADGSLRTERAADPSTLLTRAEEIQELLARDGWTPDPNWRAGIALTGPQPIAR